MQLNNFFDPKETESCSFNIRDVFVIDSMEFIKYSFLVFNTNTNPIIRELNNILFFIIFKLNKNTDGSGGILYRIISKIVKYYLHSILINNTFTTHRAFNFNSIFRKPEILKGTFNYPGNDFRSRDMIIMRNTFLFDTGNFKDRVNKLMKTVSILGHTGKEFLLFFRRNILGGKSFKIKLYRGEG